MELAQKLPYMPPLARLFRFGLIAKASAAGDGIEDDTFEGTMALFDKESISISGTGQFVPDD